MIRVWRIPFSTNVERVALALGHKRLAVEWVDVDPADRSPVEELSGQPLVPVLEEDGAVVADSTAILEYIEERYPQRPLYPLDEARGAEARAMIDWFDRVWKRPPNLLDELGYSDERSPALVEELEASLDRFEALLAGRDYLFGNELTAVDCACFPFLKYGAAIDPDDGEEFHRILNRHLGLDGHPRLVAWVARVDEHPRA